MILANDEEGLDLQTAYKRDSKILALLLQLRYLSEVRGYNLDVTSEMLLVENQELAHFDGVNDFVVSSISPVL
ncbi:MAG: hypothetical protein K5866_11630 [Treponema sp.]|nr:hypothetical protein [Treponema sp.]